mgnify:CR=1 FL=1
MTFTQLEKGKPEAVLSYSYNGNPVGTAKATLSEAYLMQQNSDKKQDETSKEKILLIIIFRILSWHPSMLHPSLMPCFHFCFFLQPALTLRRSPAASLFYRTAFLHLCISNHHNHKYDKRHRDCP